MPRKARAEVEGGLYHVIVRGNNRRRIFDSPADYEKFFSLLAAQKIKLPFFLYAYCLMTNHVHLLIERQKDSVGRIMHRVLTGYSQYYNRRYQRIGHLLQGRHKAILCQSDRYLAELVRYIHLNPVRAKMVSTPEQYQFSSHRAYLGLEAAGIVDVEPVLRHFGAKKQLAREAYRQFVAAGTKSGHQERFYLADEGRILGTEEFVDATIHRLGESKRSVPMRLTEEFKAEHLIEAVEKVCRIPREEFCGSTKTLPAVAARELLVLIACQAGASRKLISDVTGLGSSTVSRRNDAAKLKVRENAEMRRLLASIESRYYSAE
ncbi:MAG TPA: transposase [Pyrinomonadaceae bacterium]|nr:transposase [Pyrinomonadaceae bacterium]